MARRGPDYILKRGAEGTVWQFVIHLDRKRVNLAGKQVFIALKKDGAKGPAIRNAECTIDPNQFQHPGAVSFAFDAATSRLATGTYEVELKIVEADGRVWFYPGAVKPFYRALICESLG